MLPSLRSTRNGLAAAATASLFVLVGCASTGAPSPYSVRSGSTSVPSRVESGEVVSVQPVTIRPDNTVVATGTGAVLGGIAGSTIGRRGSAGQAAATVGGALLGGLLGNAVGERAGTREGYAYTIRFGDGRVSEIIQGGDNLIQPGTPVNITWRPDGPVITPAGY